MAEILVTEITDGTVDGAGYFDKLMKAVKAHLEQEYQLGRITGDVYAKVYIEALNATLAQATQFALARQNADKTAELTDAKIETEQAVRDKSEAEVAFIAQKRRTEEAQVSGTYTDANGNQVNVEGILKAKLELYVEQRDGFVKEAALKALNAAKDTWITRRTTDQGTLASTAGFGDPNIFKMLEKVATLNNITINPPGSPAQATATIVGDAVDSVTVTDGGGGYSSTAVVTLAGDGTGAIATATMKDDGEGSLAVDTITVSSGGTGYSYANVLISEP